MSKFFIAVALFLVSLGSQAQISTPEKTKFNVGLYGGLSIWKYRPMIALDVNYKNTTLRLMPNYNYYSAGITQEIMKISPVFYNLYWTASVYGGYGIEDVALPSLSSTDFTRHTFTWVGNTGLKTYFSKRMYTHIMGGVMYNKSNIPGIESKKEVAPYFEFGIGVLIKKTFPNLKREEIEE